ncbi:MAG TPA: hypothetical protein VE988_08465 [Gemmataceae bacterium]|nr:hypothetical protein [Gemmataceae bacterium]
MNQLIPGQPGFFGFNQTPWFAAPEASKRLNLSNEQKAQLNKAYAEKFTAYSNGLKALGSLSEQERAQKIFALSAMMKTELSQSAQAILKPEQLQRYQQLQLQHQGIQAFNDPTVQAKLNLNAEQFQKLEALRLEQNKTLLGIQAQMATDPTAAANQFQAFTKQSNEQINSILNAQQRQVWLQLTGDPYNFTPAPLQTQIK